MVEPVFDPVMTSMLENDRNRTQTRAIRAPIGAMMLVKKEDPACWRRRKKIADSDARLMRVSTANPRIPMSGANTSVAGSRSRIATTTSAVSTTPESTLEAAEGTRCLGWICPTCRGSSPPRLMVI